jgi:putative acetyltransferase
MARRRLELIIEAVDPLHADAIFLLHEAAGEAWRLYADILDLYAPLPVNEPAVPRSVYFVARLAGEPVGSVALRPLDELTAEVRWMYVLPSFRRQGVAHALLDRVEFTAVEFGYIHLRLETGNRQPAAIALYESCGYKQIPPFGEHMDDPTSVCFEKAVITG